MSGPATPDLPVTWRPRRTRRVAHAVAVLVAVVVVAVAAALPSSGGVPWALADRLGVVLVGALICGVLLMLARPRVTADENGLTVVNLVRRRRLDWAEVVSVEMAPGDPWVMLDLADGGRLAVMGIQGSGGAAARRAAGQLRALVAERSESDQND